MSLLSRTRLAAIPAIVLAAAPLVLASSTGASAAVPVGTAAASPAAAGVPLTRHIQQVGTAAYTPTAPGSGAPGTPSTEVPTPFGPDGFAPARSAGPNRSLSAYRAARAAAAPTVTSAAAPSPGGVVRNGPRLLASFDGLNHYDQRTANGGNQFSIEPPDQALCVGGGHVVEAVNDVFRVFAPSGSAQTGVESLNTFFGYPPAIDRTTGVRGQFVTDPTCLYDPSTRSFVLTVLTLEVDPATGAFTGDNHLDIAVAKNPTATWNIYRLDVTDDGSNQTPVHPHCPCLGDYPHVGVDANGFYVTTNEYSFFGTEYNSAQVYAFAKRALARGDKDVLVTEFDTTGVDAGRNGFTIWPAQSPTPAQYSAAAGGTEFFLSSNAAEEATGTEVGASNSIVTWSLTNTRSLDSRAPNITLRHVRVGVRTYSVPPASTQQPGPVPLATCLNTDPCATTLLGAPDPYTPEVESDLDSNDSRMQQVTYAGGHLYGALDTAVTVDGAEKAGIGWYIVTPLATAGGLHAQLYAQGKLGLAANNLTYPAIGINAAGKGVMAFTLVGDGYYPSAAYAAFDGRTGAGAIFLARAGLGPKDGFTGYRAYNDPPRSRWGDYGASAVDGGNIWIASEYIGQTCTFAEYTAAPFGTCGGTRTALANWDTRLSKLKP